MREGGAVRGRWGGAARGRLYAYIWLAYLAYPVMALFAPHLALWQRAAGGAGLATFLAAYIWALSGSPPYRPLRTGVAIAGTVALGLVLSVLLGPAWLGLFVYAGALAGWLPSTRTAAATAAAVTAVSALTTWSLGALAEGGWALVLTTALTGFAMIGVGQLIRLTQALQAARDDVARLAAADERLRIARDVHDLLGHSLSVIALKAELAQRLLPVDPAGATQQLTTVQAVARRSLAEVRATVAGYRQPSLDEALAAARSGLEAAGIRCAFVRTADPLPPASDAALAWVVREAATNVLRHSGATTCQLQIERSGGMVVLTVSDDGRGRDGSEPPAGAGTGLAGMRERLAAIHGTLVIGEAPGGGMRLQARVPPPPLPDGAGGRGLDIAQDAGRGTCESGADG